MKAEEIRVGMMVCDLDHTLQPMTVSAISANGRAAVCLWSEGNSLRQSTFSVGTLLRWSPRFWHA